MLLIIRFFWLLVFAAAEHFRDGLAYPALAAAAFLGWRGARIYWLAAPILALAAAASLLYANATAEGKTAGALGNFVFELAVFTVLSLAGYLAGWLWRRRRASR